LGQKSKPKFNCNFAIEPKARHLKKKKSVHRDIAIFIFYDITHIQSKTLIKL